MHSTDEVVGLCDTGLSEARKRELSELSVSLASEGEHRGVRSANVASEELATEHKPYPSEARKLVRLHCLTTSEP